MFWTVWNCVFLTTFRSGIFIPEAEDEENVCLQNFGKAEHSDMLILHDRIGINSEPLRDS